MSDPFQRIIDEALAKLPPDIPPLPTEILMKTMLEEMAAANREAEIATLNMLKYQAMFKQSVTLKLLLNPVN